MVDSACRPQSVQLQLNGVSITGNQLAMCHCHACECSYELEFRTSLSSQAAARSQLIQDLCVCAVIDERDVFMARALAAAATGKAAVAPALAADTGVDGAPLWRYVMGTDGPAGEVPAPVALPGAGWMLASCTDRRDAARCCPQMVMQNAHPNAGIDCLRSNANPAADVGNMWSRHGKP
jgi:hypothetical protein